MADMWEPLSPRYNIFGLDEPLKFAGNNKLPKPVIASAGNWLDAPDEDD